MDLEHSHLVCDVSFDLTAPLHLNFKSLNLPVTLVENLANLRELFAQGNALWRWLKSLVFPFMNG